jgi:hypothetical protein
MKDMGNGLHAQTLSVAMSMVLSDDATRYVSMSEFNPAPMMPGANALASTATIDELSSIAYLWITEINTATLDGLTPAQKTNMDLAKMKKLCSLQAISGMIINDKISGLINTSLNSEYIVGSTALLILRHVFIQTYILDQGLLLKPFANKAMYDAAKSAILSLKDLEDYNDKHPLVLKITGFFNHDNNQDIKIDGKKYKDYLKQIGEWKSIGTTQ